MKSTLAWLSSSHARSGVSATF